MRRAFAAVPLLLVAACQSTSVSSDDSGNVAVVVKNYGDCLAAIGAKQSDLYGDVNRDGHDVVRVHGQPYTWTIGSLGGEKEATPDTYTDQRLYETGCYQRPGG